MRERYDLAAATQESERHVQDGKFHGCGRGLGDDGEVGTEYLFEPLHRSEKKHFKVSKHMSGKVGLKTSRDMREIYIAALCVI